MLLNWMSLFLKKKEQDQEQELVPEEEDNAPLLPPPAPRLPPPVPTAPGTHQNGYDHSRPVSLQISDTSTHEVEVISAGGDVNLDALGFQDEFF